MTEPATPETGDLPAPDQAPPPSGRWARLQHRVLAPKRAWDTGIARVEASMHSEQGDVMFAVSACAAYLVQEALSVVGFNTALIGIIRSRGSGIDAPAWMIATFVSVMVLWVLTLGFLSTRMVKVAVKEHTGRDLRGLLLRNIVAGTALSLVASAIWARYDRIGSILVFLDAHSVGHPDKALVYPVVGVTAAAVWIVLRWPVMRLVAAYARIIWARVRQR